MLKDEVEKKTKYKKTEKTRVNWVNPQTKS